LAETTHTTAAHAADDVHGGHHHAHQFDSAEQQFQTAELGMWVFLATEVLTFGGLFLAYIVYRTLYPDAFFEASQHQDVALGAVNTVVLIVSSFTMALGVWASQMGRRSLLMVCLLLTIFFAGVFMVNKGFEYTAHWNEHLFPGANFRFEENPAIEGPAELFFFLYFAMTGLHGLHVTIGIGIMLWLLYMAYRRRLGPSYYTPVEVTGLYWHFVDLVWIFLFPLLYLIGGFRGF